MGLRKRIWINPGLQFDTEPRPNQGWCACKCHKDGDSYCQTCFDDHQIPFNFQENKEID